MFLYDSFFKITEKLLYSLNTNNQLLLENTDEYNFNCALKNILKIIKLLKNLNKKNNISPNNFFVHERYNYLFFPRKIEKINCCKIPRFSRKENRTVEILFLVILAIKNTSFFLTVKILLIFNIFTYFL